MGKEALEKGMEISKEDLEIKYNLVAHPLFVLTCTCKDKIAGVAAVEESMKIVEEAITSRGGSFTMRSKPEVVGQDEDEKNDNDSDDDDGDSAGSDSTESDQDETMGNIDDEAMRELLEKTKDLDVEE